MTRRHQRPYLRGWEQVGGRMVLVLRQAEGPDTPEEQRVNDTIKRVASRVRGRCCSECGAPPDEAPCNCRRRLAAEDRA